MTRLFAALIGLTATCLTLGAATATPISHTNSTEPVRGKIAMISSFSEDEKISRMAETYSQNAVDFARDQFRISLDWSDASIENVEKVLDVLCRQRTQAKPTDEQVSGMSKMFGSYIGEVFRKNHGASWGMVTLGGQDFPGLQAKNGELFWPWVKVQKRLLNGSEDNVWFYYQVIAKTKS